MSYRERVERVAAWLRADNLRAALLVDGEERREPAIRYLAGHPSDALLFVLADGGSVLLPWDVNLANRLATADEIIPYTDYKRSLPNAFAALVDRFKLAGRIEISGKSAYTLYRQLSARVPTVTIECREEGIDLFLARMRAVKDDEEIARIERAAELTNRLLQLIEERLAQGGQFGPKAGDAVLASPDEGRGTEADIALFIEREGRLLGSEGTSFETLAAGPMRSFGIHAFPAFGSGPFGGAGLSILDFGLWVDGYASDVTVTVASGRLTARQEEMIALVEQAYDLALSMVEPGRPAVEIARAVDDHFQRAGHLMPHSLGHGLGLQVHEAPALSSREGNRDILEPGMILTVEPGLYDPAAGGVRKENDILVTREGRRILTTARILRLP